MTITLDLVSDALADWKPVKLHEDRRDVVSLFNNVSTPEIVFCICGNFSNFTDEMSVYSELT